MKNEVADYLFHQGTNFNTYEYLGAHFTTVNGVSGVMFRTWAPNAVEVSVVGDFNGWQNGKTRMQKLDGGVYEVFVENLKEYDLYKFAIKGKNGKTVLKSDPYAFFSENSPSTASKIYELNGYGWQDKEYFENNKNRNIIKSPVNIYEMNLTSFKRKENGDYYTYEELILELVPYLKEMNYNFVEFMPLSEFPFDGSWGYQVTGYYSVTSRFGTPKQFMKLVDSLHKENIGVILDWVPAHFPKDSHGLYEFDGEPLYEYQGKDRQENANWGTRYFDVGREEVQSFLISNAVFLFEKFHIDGLRVDAVASMLYLDYDKKPGEWVPNIYGDNKNLEAIAFFKKLNNEVFKRYPYALMIAEESTANVKITGRTDEGALGFNFKWNMGWMNDVLSYFSVDPYFRHYDHNKMTFSLTYAYTENFILPISHDEVVHGKKSLLDKMPGSYEDKFANNRAFLGYMFAHPGKKLTFMGEEFGQFKEWNYEEGLEFFLKCYPMHNALSTLYKDINAYYLKTDALWSIDDGWNGFKWIEVNDKDNNFFAFKRIGESGKEVVVLVNLSGNDLKYYFINTDKGEYEVVLSSDKKIYGGKEKFKKRKYKAVKNRNTKKTGFYVNISKLSFIYLEKQ